jgi:hypothetical protein
MPVMVGASRTVKASPATQMARVINTGAPAVQVIQAVPQPVVVEPVVVEPVVVEPVEATKDDAPPPSDGPKFGGRCPDDAGFATKCLHGGQEPDPVTGARTTNICMSTAFCL